MSVLIITLYCYKKLNKNISKKYINKNNNLTILTS